MNGRWVRLFTGHAGSLMCSVKLVTCEDQPLQHVPDRVATSVSFQQDSRKQTLPDRRTDGLLANDILRNGADPEWRCGMEAVWYNGQRTGLFASLTVIESSARTCTGTKRKK